MTKLNGSKEVNELDLEALDAASGGSSLTDAACALVKGINAVLGAMDGFLGGHTGGGIGSTLGGSGSGGSDDPHPPLPGSGSGAPVLY